MRDAFTAKGHDVTSRDKYTQDELSSYPNLQYKIVVPVRHPGGVCQVSL
jgi:hypothetical protein